MSKKRSSGQQLEQESIAKFKDLLSAWIVNELSNDFGFDFEVRIADDIEGERNQKVTGMSFYTQLKATDDDCSNGYFHDLNTSDVKLFSNTNIPVLLVKYYRKCNDFVYVIVQTHQWDVLDKTKPNWAEQDAIRIHLSKKIEHLSELKVEIIDAQKRIVRKTNYNLGLGEGINIEDFGDLKEKDLSEFKYKSLLSAFSKIQMGDTEEGIRLLQETYDIKREDTLTLTACLNLILQYNPINPENQRKIFDQSSEGEDLSRKIGLSGFEEYFKISKLQLLLIRNITSLSQLLLSKKMGENHDAEVLSPFTEIEILKLYNAQQLIISKIGVSLKKLIENGDLYEFILAQLLLIESVTYQIQKLGLIDEHLLDIEKEYRSPFVSTIEEMIPIINDEHLLQFYLFKLGNYYYWVLNYDQAEKYIERAITLTSAVGYTGYLESYNTLLEDIRNKNNPYDEKNRISEEDVSNLPFSEIKDMMTQNVQLQGFDLTKTDDEIINAINVGLADSDPTHYLKYCENIRIGYLFSSELGRQIGLMSLGSKLIWCKEAKRNVQGFSLQHIFNSFIGDNCANCTKRMKRDEDWVCTVKKLDEILLDPHFQEYLRKIHEHPNY